MLNERRHHIQRDTHAATIRTLRTRGNQTGWSIQHNGSAWLLYRQDAKLEQCRDDADAVTA
ncbi:hypothetical protein D3C85_1865200 [compost metagenome]